MNNEVFYHQESNPVIRLQDNNSFVESFFLLKKKLAGFWSQVTLQKISEIIIGKTDDVTAIGRSDFKARLHIFCKSNFQPFIEFVGQVVLKIFFKLIAVRFGQNYC